MMVITTSDEFSVIDVQHGFIFPAQKTRKTSHLLQMLSLCVLIANDIIHMYNNYTAYTGYHSKFLSRTDTDCSAIMTLLSSSGIAAQG